MSGAEILLDALRPGARVFVQAATTAPAELPRWLSGDPARADGVTFVSVLIPGVNNFDFAGVSPGARLETFLVGPALRASFAAGRIEAPALCYSQIGARLRDAAFDVAILQVTPPDAAGACSFGVAADFGPLAWRNAKRVIAFINTAMPRPPRAPTIPFSAIHTAIETDAQLITAPPAKPPADLAAAAARAAAFVSDGATIQTGIGAAPAAILPFLRDRRGLRIASGMMTEDYRLLAEAGALGDRRDHCAGIAVGGAGFYDYLAADDLTAFASVDITHNAEALGKRPGFVSFGSALEVDLFGQINLEWRRGQLVSGVGGAPDFARAARFSRGGAALIVMPSTAEKGAVSRIVPMLKGPSVSMSRDMADAIVTEHGATRIGGLGLDARAEALIELAAPAFRGGLRDAWRDLRRGL